MLFSSMDQFVSLPFWQFAAIICIALFCIGVGITYWLRDVISQGTYQANRRIEEEKRQGKWPR